MLFLRSLSLFVFAFALRVNAQVPSAVDIRLVHGSTPGTMAVQVRPDSVGFSGLVVSHLAFTVRWAASSPAVLVGGSSTCQAGSTLSPSAEITSAGFKYRTYNGIGLEALPPACAWVVDTWVTIRTIPIIGDVGCTAFNIVNDAYTSANNRNYYCQLGGLNRTGVIIGAPVDCLDCAGTPNGTALPGTPCNDGLPCTVDTYNAACTCVGVVLDTDLDGTCDALDACPTDANKIAPGACGCGNPEPGSACDDLNANTTNDVTLMNCTCSGVPFVRVSPRIFLEGGFPTSFNMPRMNDALRSNSLIPLAEPYTDLGYIHVAGGLDVRTTAAVLAITSQTQAVVDWVVVEARSAVVPYAVLASRSALVKRDGLVTSTDGTSAVTLAVPSGNYRIAIRHRNHLGIMTSTSRALSMTTATVDFSTTSNATLYGSDAQKTITIGINPVQAMWAGDANFNGSLQYTGANNDRDPMLVSIGSTTPNNTLTGLYTTNDVNMDGQVQYTGNGNDRDPILVNVGATTPNNTRVAQLP